MILVWLILAALVILFVYGAAGAGGYMRTMIITTGKRGRNDTHVGDDVSGRRGAGGGAVRDGCAVYGSLAVGNGERGGEGRRGMSDREDAMQIY